MLSCYKKTYIFCKIHRNDISNRIQKGKNLRNRLRISLLVAAVSTYSLGIDMAVKQFNNPQGTQLLLKVTDKPGNPKDWIGVYPKGASNDWGNQVAWTWAKDTLNNKDWYKLNTSSLSTGEYEARFFLNNSYRVEKKVPFAIKNTVTLSSRDNYTRGNVNIGIKNQASLAENWVGIYPQGSTNDWGNVVTWKWSTGKDKLSFERVPSGKYEARIFYKNSFKVENSSYFTVGKTIEGHNTVDIQSNKNSYTPNDTINLNIVNQAADKQNWVGIYPVGSSNDWANVVDWTWTKGQSSITFKAQSAGNYEARLFYNNSYKLEDKIGFSVQDKNEDTNIFQTSKAEYTSNETVSVNITYPLSGDKDWVGIYHKNDISNWTNVVAWKLIPNEGTFSIDKLERSMPIGDYEARLFYHNKYNAQVIYPFQVTKNTFHTQKCFYNPNENVSIVLNYPLSGDNDWVGIFPIGSSSKKNEAISWKKITGQGRFELNQKKLNMPVGEYEARLFYHNGDKPKISYSFTVSKNREYPKTTTFSKRSKFEPLQLPSYPRNLNFKLSTFSNFRMLFPIMIFLFVLGGN